MDLHRITLPPRLVKVSHQLGSGKGCATRAGVATARPSRAIGQ
jgi:hypothetical protein